MEEVKSTSVLTVSTLNCLVLTYLKLVYLPIEPRYEADILKEKKNTKSEKPNNSVVSKFQGLE